MTRSFTSGRQSELLLNEDMYKLYEVLQNIIANASDPTVGPPSELEGSLWLDRQTPNGGAELKYFDAGLWKSVFDTKFQMFDQLLNPVKPTNPVPGQFWLNDETLMYFNGVDWKPVRAAATNSSFNIDSFEQFLLLNPLSPSGSRVIDDMPSDFNLADVKDWTPTTDYSLGEFVLRLGQLYKCISSHKSGTIFGDDASMWTIVTLKSQFLLPSSQMDKFFLNGLFTNDFEVMNGVTIQYPTERMQGMTASAVHVNPSKLTKITKKLMIIDKTDLNNSIIKYPELDTEFYAFSGGLGKLLTKTASSDTDYLSSIEGIKLSPTIATNYDLVLAITYNFERVKGEGKLIKGKISLNGQNSLYIGQISDPKCVFVQGLYLDEDPVNYTYDSVSGYLNLALENKMDVSVLSFTYKEIGTIASVDMNETILISPAIPEQPEVWTNDPINGPILVRPYIPEQPAVYGPNPNFGKGIINLAKVGSTKVHEFGIDTNNRRKMMVFVSGENLNSSVADYVYDEVNHTISVANANVGMKYAVVDTGNMIYDMGTVKSGSYPYVPYLGSDFSEGTKALLFVDGILVSQKDIDLRDSDGKITTYGLTAGQDYILLRDTEDRLIFDDALNFTTIPTEHMDTAVVYIENNLICDAASICVSSLPKLAVDGEIKQLLSNGEENWYQFKSKPVATWEQIIDSNTVTILNNTVQGYSSSAKSISILQNYGVKDCSYYAYTYANSVEEPLLFGNITTDGVSTEFQVGFRHPYKVGINSLQVWLDGSRQYYFKEIDSRKFELCYKDADGNKIPIDAGRNIFYIVEKLEGIETKACETEVLTIDNRAPGTVNIFQTNKPLYPGTIRVYYSGYRQPKSAYSILNANMLMVNGDIIGGFDNFPIEIVEQDGKLIQVHHTIADEIFIEIRNDYSIREFETTIGLDGKRIQIINNDLWDSIYNSKDLIMIYINGAAYNGNYSFDKDGQAIILNEDKVTDCLMPNIDKVILEWR